MSFELSERLVVGISSSALFDQSIADTVFREKGQDAYTRFQRDQIDVPLEQGVAFPFISRLLKLNDLRDQADPVVEVIIISKNDPIAGLRVNRSIEKYALPISRTMFTKGRSPTELIKAFQCELFLSANRDDVVAAVRSKLPAGHVLKSQGNKPADKSPELMVSFDFDGVLADDESERVYKERGLDLFRYNERIRVNDPLQPGPLSPLLRRLSDIQKLEKKKKEIHSRYKPRLRTSIITARNRPADERMIKTLESWGVSVDESYALGGVDKKTVLDVVKPSIFFDDQLGHLEAASSTVPCVHIPFGVRNEPAEGKLL